MATVKFKWETPALETHFAAICGQNIHSAFRLHCPHAKCGEIYDLVPKIENWHDVCRAAARTVIQYGLRHPNLKQSVNSRRRIAWLVAKRSLRELRRQSLGDRRRAKVGSAACRVYNFIQFTITFEGYRIMLDPLAQEVISRMIVSSKDCPSCRVQKKMRRGKGQACDACDKFLCPIHCECATGEYSWPRRVTLMNRQKKSVKTKCSGHGT